jgi:hypothetical protein
MCQVLFNFGTSFKNVNFTSLRDTVYWFFWIIPSGDVSWGETFLTESVRVFVYFRGPEIIWRGIWILRRQVHLAIFDMRVKPMAEVQHRPLSVFYLGLLYGGASLICLLWSLDLTHHFESVPAILSFTESTNPENASWYKTGESTFFFLSDWFLGFRILCVPISTSRTEDHRLCLIAVI